MADRITWNKTDNNCVTLYPGDTPRKAWWGYADHFPKLLPHSWSKSVIFVTLFMTWQNIWYPIYDPCSWYSYPKHKLWRAFGDGFFDNFKKVASSKKHTQYFQTRVLKPYPIYDQSGWKTLPFWGCTYPYSPYKGVAPLHYLTCAIPKSNIRLGSSLTVQWLFKLFMFTLVWSWYWLLPLIDNSRW